MIFRKTLAILTFSILFVFAISAQKVALKTNLLTDAVLSPNLGIEVGLSPKWTIEGTYEMNAWTINDHKWRHWFVHPEARYWFCNTFQGNFIGIHAIVGQFNFANIDNHFKLFNNDFSGLSDKRYQGWGAGAGVSYGHSWILAKHWNMELEIGIGWIYTRYDVYPCEKCGTKLEEDKVHNYVGPTKLAWNIEYVF